MKASFLRADDRHLDGGLEDSFFFCLGGALIIGWIGAFLGVVGTQAMTGREDVERYFFRWFFGAWGIGAIVGLISVLFTPRKLVGIKVYAGFVLAILGGTLLSVRLATDAMSAHLLTFAASLGCLAIPPICGIAGALAMKRISWTSNKSG